MDISWVSIGKVLVSFLGVYLVLPFLLLIRDLLLWKVICKVCLTKGLRNDVRRRAMFAYEWNTKHAVKMELNGNGYFIDGKAVTQKEFHKHEDRGDFLSSEISQLDLTINARSKIVGLLIKHYKHDAKNPVGDWMESEYKRVERQHK
jgi:hypothetical protein